MSVLIHSIDFEQLAWEYFERAAKHGVHHAEIFFDPQAHLDRGVSYQTMIDGFSAARDRAQTELGISTLLISCFLRHIPTLESIRVFDLPEVQENYRNGKVAGIGLDSSEKEFPPHLFKELFAKAESLGVRRTAHAGEEGPASYIASAIETLVIQRIDHGLRLADDSELMKSVAESGMLLTLCPLSNVLLQCVKSVSEIPIRQYIDAGVKFSINSDDPAYFGGNYILDNYCAVHETFDLSVDEWENICRAGISGSWCGEERKAEMIAVLEALIGHWK